MLEEFAAFYKCLTVRRVRELLAMQLCEPLSRFFPGIAVEGMIVIAYHFIELAGRVFNDM
jgi:hypothetical protein